MYLLRIVLATTCGLLFMLLAACESSKPPAKRGPSRLADVTLPTFVPTVRGGGYVYGLLGQVWYVQGNNAVKVRGLPTDVTTWEIIPSVEGGAYLLDFQRVWRLDETTATRVDENEAMSESPAESPLTYREGALFALWQHELAKRRRAEQQIDAEHQYE